MDNLFCKKNRLTQNKIRLIQKTLIYFSIILLVGIIVFNFYNLFNNKADNNEINEIQVFKQIAVNDLRDSGDDMDLIGCEFHVALKESDIQSMTFNILDDTVKNNDIISVLSHFAYFDNTNNTFATLTIKYDKSVFDLYDYIINNPNFLQITGTLNDNKDFTLKLKRKFDPDKNLTIRLNSIGT